MISSAAGTKVEIFRPTVGYFQNSLIPTVCNPNICQYFLLPSQQWCLQEFFAGDFMGFESPLGPFDNEFIKKMQKFYRERVVTALPPIPSNIYINRYKSVKPSVMLALSDWFILSNEPTRFNLLLFWLVMGFNDKEKFCFKVQPFNKMCAERCKSCMRRSTVIDVHEILHRSGICYGIAAKLLERVLETGVEVNCCLPFLFILAGFLF